MFDEHVLPNEHPTKGWNRASLIFWSRKPYRPKLTDEDRVVPRGGGPEMLATCAAAGTLIAVSLVWFVLLLVRMYSPLTGEASGEIVAAAAVGFTAFLYAVAALRGRALS
jgi:hypothetical protein